MLFNGTGKMYRTGSAWKEGGGEERVGVGEEGRNDPNNVYTCE
jgi:hypothetical protein